MLLKHSNYFIKEHVGFMKLTDTYDILDPQTQQILGVAKDEPPTWAKWLRLLIQRSLLPTNINIYESTDQKPLLSLHKGAMFFRAKVIIKNKEGQILGYLKSKFLSLGGGFWVYNNQDLQIAEVKGDWKGWNFKLLSNEGQELGTVTKKWSGIGKELFTTADNYMIALNEAQPNLETNRSLLLAAGLAIDIVFKERQK